MPDNIQALPFPNSQFPETDCTPQSAAAITLALALGLAGAGLGALFVCAHWSIALAAGLIVVVLSAMESAAFLLMVIFSMPLAWLVKGHNVLLAMHGLVVVGFFFGRFLRGNLHLRRLLGSRVSRASFSFWCAAAVPVLLRKGALTIDSARAVYELGTYVGFYFVVLAWLDSQERIRRVLWLVLLSAAVTSMFAVYQQIAGGYSSLWLTMMPPDDVVAMPWAGRSTSFLGHPNSLAFYLNLALPLALACYLRGQRKWKKLGGWTLGLGFLALLSTQSVGGLVAFLSTLILGVLCFARNRKKAFAYLVGITALAGSLYLLKSVLNPTHTQESLGIDLVMRLLFWGTAWSSFVHSPVFGIGWGNFVRLYGADPSLFFASLPAVGFEVHNIYLQLLAETGLVGFVSFLYLVRQSWRQARYQLHESEDFLDLALAFGVLGALLTLLLHGFIDVPFFAQSGLLLWSLFGLLVANGRLRYQSGFGTETSKVNG